MTKRARRRRRIGAAVAVAALAAAELTLRAVWPSFSQNDRRIEDPLLVYRHPAGMRLDNGENTNSLGFRGPEMPFEKPAGVTRLMVLGDSVPFGSECATAFPEILERLLSAGRDRRLQVVNASVPGYYPDLSVNFLRRKGLAMSPDMVLLVVSIQNDIRQEASYAATPVGSPLDHLALYRFAVRGWTKVRPAFGGKYRPPRGQPIRVQPDPEDPWSEPMKRCVLYVNVYRHEPQAWVEDGWRNLFKTLRTFRETCDARGIAGYVVILPDIFQLDGKLQRNMLRMLGDPPSAMSWDLPQRRLTRFLSEADIPYIDLLSAFQAEPAPRTLYYPQDTHYSVAGHTLAAREIARRISLDRPDF